MGRHIPLIGIVIAVVLAIAIVAAGSRPPDSSPTPSASASEPSGHALGGEPMGMVDSVALRQQIDALERAYAANPASLRIVLNLGDAYYQVRQLDKAAELYQEALSSHPDHPSAVIRLAMVWYARGGEAKAVKAIQEVIAALPDNQEAHYDLALIYFHLQDARAARTEWMKAARIDPDSQLGQASQRFVDLLAGQAQTPAPLP